MNSQAVTNWLLATLILFLGFVYYRVESGRLLINSAENAAEVMHAKKETMRRIQARIDAEIEAAVQNKK